VKRKILLPLIISLAVVASVSAGTYTAQVTMNVDPTVTSTSAAELAFESVGGAVDNDFIVTADTGGGANQITFDFSNVQPDSVYSYMNVLYVTNMKPYRVKLRVSDVSGDIKTLLDSKQAVLTLYGRYSGHPENVPPGVILPSCGTRGSMYNEYAYGGYDDSMYDSGYGIMNTWNNVNPTWHPQTLQAYANFLTYPGDWNSCRIFLSFRLATCHSCTAGSYDGTITLQAVDY
jgi:hypothetical protein